MSQTTNELAGINDQTGEAETALGKALDVVQVLTLPMQPELGSRVYFEHCGSIWLGPCNLCGDGIDSGKIIVKRITLASTTANGTTLKLFTGGSQKTNTATLCYGEKSC